MFLDDMSCLLNRSIFRYESVLKYLESRNVFKEDIEKYRIGYNRIIGVPDDGSFDRSRFMEEMWRGKKFENKLMFPVLDAIGRTIGFYGRPIEIKNFTVFVLEEAKYNGFLFGLYQALPHIYKENKVYVVEGPFDCFALSKVLPNTVATMTSGMYENQYNLLRFFSDRIITVFDSDEAGDTGREYVMKKHSSFNPGSESQHIYTVDIGYEDPAKCLEILGITKFKKHVLRKINEHILF